MAQIEPFHHPAEERRRLRGAIALLRLHEHGRRPRVLLDVINIVTEALKTDEIMDILPDHSGNRHFRHHPEQDDFLPGGNVHALF